jgi:hypothetical protein
VAREEGIHESGTVLEIKVPCLGNGTIQKIKMGDISNALTVNHVETGFRSFHRNVHSFVNKSSTNGISRNWTEWFIFMDVFQFKVMIKGK